MLRLRALFAIILLILLLPMWRYLDMLVISWPNSSLYAFAFYFLVLFFLIVPIWLLRPKFHFAFNLLMALPFALLAWSLPPLSGKATRHGEQKHCGPLTYTGLFYPIHEYLTLAHADDLELRNQLCWVRKMIQKVPERFESKEDLENYLRLMAKRLLEPGNKYRTVLPLLAFLNGKILSVWVDSNVHNQLFSSGKLFMEGVQFWEDQYTISISEREYSWSDWPHSSYIKFEYGILENNWDSIIDGLEIRQ